ncbi:MAG TPA: hypothetical protein VKF32_16550, partial [Thermoanaerobaculia bacterium]|nr:hypothetical protein [Thermoanaerobaculia bacterium]
PTEPGIKGQYSDEFSLGVELEPVQNLSVSAKWIYRSLKRVIEDGGTLTSDGTLAYFIFNPGTTFIDPLDPNHPLVGLDYVDTPPKRYYKAIQLSAQKRFNNRLQFIASYTWSKLEGNYDGVFQTSTTQLDPNINSAFDYRVFLENAYGYLSNDRRHTVKVDGSYVTPFGLQVGLSAYYFTGTPLTERGYFNLYRNYELYLSPRGTVGRTPDVYEADLHLGYEIPLGKVNVMIGADIFNLLNLQRTLQQDERRDVSQGSSTDDPVHIGDPGPANNSYLSAISFTGRRTVRLNARVSF